MPALVDRVESGDTPPPVDQCKPNAYKRYLWVLWWKQHLRHKLGQKYANKYDKYFDDVYKPCVPKPEDKCKTPRTLLELLRRR